MANYKQTYRLPDYTSTSNFDEYAAAWKNMAAPIEEALGIQLMGFDPEFLFSKGNPQLITTTVALPIWFVRDLNKTLNKLK